MASYFEEAILTLESYGLMDIWLPFFLIFIAVYAVLQKIKIFKKGNDEAAEKKSKTFNLLVALIMALLPVVFHVTNAYPDARFDVVQVINDSVAVVGLMVVAFLMISLVTGPFGHKMDIKSNMIAGWILGGALLFIINFAIPSVPAWVGILTIFIVALAIKFGAKKSDKQDPSALVMSLLMFGILTLVIYIFGANAGYFTDIPYWMQDSGTQTMIVFVAVLLAIISFVTKGK